MKRMIFKNWQGAPLSTDPLSTKFHSTQSNSPKSLPTLHIQAYFMGLQVHQIQKYTPTHIHAHARTHTRSHTHTLCIAFLTKGHFQHVLRPVQKSAGSYSNSLKQLCHKERSKQAKESEYGSHQALEIIFNVAVVLSTARYCCNFEINLLRCHDRTTSAYVYAT